MRCFHKIFVFVVPRFEMRCRAEQEQGIHWVGQRAFPPHTPCFSCLQDVAETKTVSKMHKKWKKEGKNKTRRGKGSFYDDRFRYFFLPLVTKKEAEARVFQLQSPSQKVERTKNNETLRAHKKREKSILTTTTRRVHMCASLPIHRTVISQLENLTPDQLKILVPHLVNRNIDFRMTGRDKDQELEIHDKAANAMRNR